jgi:hypothetical protein
MSFKELYDSDTVDSTAISMSSRSDHCNFEQKCLGEHPGVPKTLHCVELYLFPRKKSRGAVALAPVSPQVCPCITITNCKDLRFYKPKGALLDMESLVPDFGCQCK